MKTLVLLGMLLIASAAEAIPLRITEGSLHISHYADWEPGLYVEGPGFELRSWSNYSVCCSAAEIGGFTGYADLTLNGRQVPQPPLRDEYDYGYRGSFDLKVAGRPETICSEEYGGTCEPWRAPFTMTGHLDLENGYDVRGHGVVTHFLNPVYYTLPDGTEYQGGVSYTLSYTFGPGSRTTVPEPETWLLLLAGLAVVVFVARRQRLNLSTNKGASPFVLDQDGRAAMSIL